MRTSRKEDRVDSRLGVPVRGIITAMVAMPLTVLAVSTTNAFGVFAQTQSAVSSPAATIRGRVTAASGTPLSGVEIRVSEVVSSNAQRVIRAVTNEQGLFEVLDVPVGRVSVLAIKSGYQTLRYGQRQAVDRPREVDVGAGQVVTGIDFNLPPANVIAVHVDDDFGGPIAGVRVEAQRSRYVNGERVLSTVASAETNDRGDAQLNGIASGTYLVKASPVSSQGAVATLGANDSGWRFAQTFHPGVSTVGEAHRVLVGAGESVAVRFRLVAVRATRIAGTVRGADGSVFTGTNLRLIGEGATRSALVGGDGSFAFTDVLPGKYRIVVASSSAAVVQEFAMVAIDVADTDLTGLLVTTTVGTTLKGRLMFDTGMAPPTLWPGAFDIVPTFVGPAASAGSSVLWNDDWTFQIDRLAGPAVLRVRSLADAAAGWFLKSVVIDRQDVTDSTIDFGQLRGMNGVEVTLTRRRSAVRGTVTDLRKVPVRDFTAVVFSEEKDRWTPGTRAVVAVRSNADGAFEVAGLPDGQYLVAAVETLEPGQEQDVDVLEHLRANAVRVTLGEGETKSVAVILTTLY